MKKLLLILAILAAAASIETPDDHTWSPAKTGAQEPLIDKMYGTRETGPAGMETCRTLPDTAIYTCSSAAAAAADTHVAVREKRI